MTVRERIAVSICVKVLVTIFGLVFRRLSPKSAPAHWKSWEGADSLSMPDPVRNTSHRQRNMFHCSSVIPTSTLGCSSFGPRGTDAGFVAGAGERVWWARP